MNPIASDVGGDLYLGHSNLKPLTILGQPPPKGDVVNITGANNAA
jgi:hypothetical protein